MLSAGILPPGARVGPGCVWGKRAHRCCPTHGWGQEVDGAQDPGGGPSAARGRRQPGAQGWAALSPHGSPAFVATAASGQKQGLVFVFWLFCEPANPPLHSHQDPVFAWVLRPPWVQPQQEFTPSYHILPCPCLGSVMSTPNSLTAPSLHPILPPPTLHLEAVSCSLGL